MGELTVLRILLVAGEGGHKEQLYRLSRLIVNHAELIHCVETNEDMAGLLRWSDAKIEFKNCISGLSKSPVRINRFAGFILSALIFPLSIITILKINPDGVIVHGPLFSVPFLLAAKICRKKIIFVESWSKFQTASSTGKLAKLLKCKILYQNTGLQYIYPDGKYVGRL